jgi:hypothetical protein
MTCQTGTRGWPERGRHHRSLEYTCTLLDLAGVDSQPQRGHGPAGLDSRSGLQNARVFDHDSEASTTQVSAANFFDGVSLRTDQAV